MVVIALVCGVLGWSAALTIMGLEMYFFLTVLFPAVVGFILALLTSLAVFALPCIWVLKRALHGTTGAVTGIAKAVTPLAGMFAAGSVGVAAAEYLGEKKGRKSRAKAPKESGPHVPPPPMAPHF